MDDETVIKETFLELLTWTLLNRPEWLEELKERKEEFKERVKDWV